MSYKNFVKEGQKLPLFGIGPYLITGMSVLTLNSIVFCGYVYRIGILNGIWVWVFRIAGIILSALGVLVWYSGALGSGMDKNISENRLKTDGIYAWVRNPMYSGIWLFITGISFMWHNLYMIHVFFLNWGIMTFVLKNTEEKWLADLYGDEYEKYKCRVNRCIPGKKLCVVQWLEKTD